MATKYVLAVLTIVFLIAGMSRHDQVRGRTWLLVGVIFGVVSGWLFFFVP